jgi:uncharacterized coiled-coil protein SlyX
VKTKQRSELSPSCAGQPDFLNADKRFTLIETKLAYLENFTAQLQEVSVEQAKMLDRLKAENRLLHKKLTTFEESFDGSQTGAHPDGFYDMPADEKPPHY